MGGASSEENAVSLFIEVAESLHRHDVVFHGAVKAHIRTWLSPSGYLSENYIKTCHDLSLAQLYARMSYALFRGREEKVAWGPLFERVVSHGGEGLISAEMAFVIYATSMTWVAN